MNEIQKIEYAILQEIKRICDENNISFQLSGGSVLGAVRHGGFIPWDDDIDVGMLRPDYERFLEIAPLQLRKPYTLQTYNNNSDHYYYFSHVVDTRYSVKRLGSLDHRIEKVWVDIYPLDGLPKFRLMRGIHYCKLTFFNFMYHVGYFDKVNIARPDRALYQKVIIRIIKKLHPFLKIEGSKWRNRIDVQLKKYGPADSEYVFNFIGVKGIKEIFPKAIFYETRSARFENDSFLIPDNYELYLSQLYGNYMTVPPDSEKNSHPMELMFDETE